MSYFHAKGNCGILVGLEEYTYDFFRDLHFRPPVRLDGEQRLSTIWRTPLKDPHGAAAAAGGSRRWHLQIWRWHR